MRMLATALSTVLAFGTLVVPDAPSCRADVATSAATTPAPEVTAAPQPGTDEEERVYARREAESPAAQEFAGGWFFAFLILVALVVIIVLLVKKGEL